MEIALSFITGFITGAAFIVALLFIKLMPRRRK